MGWNHEFMPTKEHIMEALLKDIFESVIEGDNESAPDLVQQALDQDVDPDAILRSGLIAAMDQVGKRFEEGDFYVPEMLISARAMQAGLSVLKPQLIEQGIKSTGTVVIGTVKGDLHDIGKNLVGMMLEGAGFDVVDLGTDVNPGSFVDAVKEHEPQVIGLSALLTTTMQSMKATIEAIEQAGVREDVFVMIGGAPVTSAFAEEIGADAYGPDASQAVALAKRAAS
jgi:5-methyltetrahydrofolate--homocysteine methyltransferase